jgi:hypothetical protein
VKVQELVVCCRVLGLRIVNLLNSVLMIGARLRTRVNDASRPRFSYEIWGHWKSHKLSLIQRDYKHFTILHRVEIFKMGFMTTLMASYAMPGFLC